MELPVIESGAGCSLRKPYFALRNTEKRLPFGESLLNFMIQNNVMEPSKIICLIAETTCDSRKRLDNNLKRKTFDMPLNNIYNITNTSARKEKS